MNSDKASEPTAPMDKAVHYIKRVTLSGLWQRYDIVWNLHPDVNILAGINGSGKTTIFNCVSGLILTGKLPGLYVGNMKSMHISFDEGKGGIHYLQVAAGVEGGQTSCHTPGKTLDELKKTINMEFISTFDIPLKQAEAVRKLSNDNVTTELDWQIDQLQRKYLDYQLTVSRKKYALVPGNLFHPHIKETFDELDYPQARFWEIIDRLFSQTGKTINRDKNQIEFLSGDKDLSPFQLSSGEKQLLIILLTVLVQDNKPAILLMDEPEISLHIEWQRKLIQHIRELNPNVQVIIATHSPAIMMEGWLDKVFEVRDIIVKDYAK